MIHLGGAGLIDKVTSKAKLGVGELKKGVDLVILSRFFELRNILVPVHCCDGNTLSCRAVCCVGAAQAPLATLPTQETSSFCFLLLPMLTFILAFTQAQ